MSAASCVSSFPLSRESIDLGQRKHDDVTAHWYKLLFEIKRHESYFRNQPEELRSGLTVKGMATSWEMDCQLALLDGIYILVYPNPLITLPEMGKLIP